MVVSSQVNYIDNMKSLRENKGVGFLGFHSFHVTAAYREYSTQRIGIAIDFGKFYPVDAHSTCLGL